MHRGIIRFCDWMEPNFRISDWYLIQKLVFLSYTKLFEGSATVTKALFLYIDELSENVISNFFLRNTPITGKGLGQYADLFSLTSAIIFSGNTNFWFNPLIFGITVAIAIGAKESSRVNNIFTLINLSVVVTVIISGLWKVRVSNWSIPAEEVGEEHGTGGFAPYGVKGVIQGAARCFFGFIGFDCIAAAGEEAKTPQKSIPISVVVSLLTVFFAYFGVSAVLTMMVPYYLQVKATFLNKLEE